MSGFACPCCGFLTRSSLEYGTFEICPICYWEDDPVQFADPDMVGGANSASLNRAQLNFKEFGANAKEDLKSVRLPTAAEIEAIAVMMYRPVGPVELQLIKESGYIKWPPRLPEQPIFYPVTNEEYAREIAETWNVKDSGSGYVTKFVVKKEFMRNYKIKTVGARHHQEWWIPAGELEQLNQNIVGQIKVIAEFTLGEGSQNTMGDS